MEDIISALLIGSGFLLLLGAYRNKKLFGANGFVTQALKSGKTSTIGDAPQAYEVPTGKTLQSADVSFAVNDIKSSNPTLGANIENLLADPSQSNTNLLASYLTMADRLGLSSSANTIRQKENMV